MTFVLLARDVAAPDTIRQWIELRLHLGKNKPDDPQIVEADRCANIMEEQRESGKFVSSKAAEWPEPPMMVGKGTPSDPYLVVAAEAPRQTAVQFYTDWCTENEVDPTATMFTGADMCDFAEGFKSRVTAAPAAPSERAKIFSSTEIAQQLANVGGFDRWVPILDKWLASHIDSWKEEERIWRAGLSSQEGK